MKSKSHLRTIVFSLCFGCCLAISAYGQNGTWTTKAPMPTARSAFSVGEVNGILYAVGGSNARPYVQPLPDSSSDVVEAYNPTTDSWTTKASMPT